MLYTSVGCRRQLPNVLVEYLWRLAGESGEERQSFLLTPRWTGGGEIQEILIRRGKTSSWRSVFGYEPVQAEVEVQWADGDGWMSLAGEMENIGVSYKQSGKEAAACTA